MVRVNPVQMDNPAASKAEVDAVLDQGADMIMLPMFSLPEELHAFAGIVAGRVGRLNLNALPVEAKSLRVLLHVSTPQTHARRHGQC